jgi:hypothetical protein
MNDYGSAIGDEPVSSEAEGRFQREGAVEASQKLLFGSSIRSF